jgi:TP901 family phage tail tape measure protein
MTAVQIAIQLVPELDVQAANKILASLKQSFGALGESITPIDPKVFAAGIGAGSDAAKGLQENLAKAGVEGEKAFREVGDQVDVVAKKGRTAFDFNQTVQQISQLSDALGKFTQPFIALDTATANLRTLGPEAAALAPNLREAAIAMSKDLPFAAAELQQTMFDALASGVKGGEEGLKAFAETAAKLATGGASSIGDSTTLLAGQLNAYGKSAEDANTFSDIFFNTVNFGVTSIPELSNTLSNVIPTAAAAGVEIENVGAALAVMTSKGVPTAQSTTKLNQLLLELQKPSAELAPILKAAGVSMESLKQDDLPVTLGKVKDALDATGKSAVQAFSSSEASAAFSVLAGDIDGFSQTFIDVRDTTGSAENAYVQMSDSIQTSTQQMLSKVEAFVIGGLDTVGPAVVGAVQGVSQLAPLVVTLGGLKDFLPTEAIAKFVKGILDSVIPALVKMGVLRASNVAAVSAEVTAEAAATAAKVAHTGATVAETAATGGATVATYALNTAFLANPIFLVVASVAALVGAYALLGSSTKNLGDATKDAHESLDRLNKATSQAEAVKKNSASLTELGESYKKLQVQSALIVASGGDASATQLKMADAAGKVAERAPEAADAIGDLSDKVGGSSAQWAVNTDALKRYNDEQERIATSNASDAIADFDDQNKALFESVEANRVKMKQLREERDKLNTPQGQEAAKGLDVIQVAIGGPLVGLGKFVGLIDDADDKLGNVRESINKISPELEAAKKQQVEGIQKYAEMGFSVDEIAVKLGVAKEIIQSLAPPDFRDSLVNTEKFKDAVKGLTAEQQQGVAQVVHQSEAYKAAALKVGELGAKLADAKAGGNLELAGQIEKDLADAQKVANEKKLTLQTSLDNEDVKKGLAAIPKEAQAILQPIQQTITLVSDDKQLKETQSKAGGIIREIAELQKDQAGAASDAQKSVYDDQLIAKQEQFKANLEAQAIAVADNEQALAALRAQKDPAMDPAAAEKLNAEIANLEAKTAEAAKQFNNTAVQGKKVGAIKGDIKQVATEFGFAGKAADGVAANTRRVDEDAKKAAVSVGDIGAQFEATMKAANDTRNALASQYAANRIKLQGQLTDVERQAIQVSQKNLEAQAAQVSQTLKAGGTALDAARQKLGFNSEKDAKAAEERAKQAREAAKRLAEEGAKAFREQKAQEQAAAAQLIDEELERNFTLLALRREKALERTTSELDRIKELGDRSGKLTGQIAIDRAKFLDDLEHGAAEKLLSARIALNEQEIALERAQAEQIQGEDLRSVNARFALLKNALDRETELKLTGIVAQSKEIIGAAEAAAKTEVKAQVDAQAAVADAKIALDRQIAILRKKNANITNEDLDASTAGLRATLDTARANLSSARTALADSTERFQRDLLAALRTPVAEQTEAQIALIKSLSIEPDQQAALIGRLNQVINEQGKTQNALAKQNEETTHTILLQARLATITDVAERERVQKLIEAKKTLDAELAQIAAAEIAIAVQREQSGATGPDPAEAQLAQARLAAQRKFQLAELQSTQEHERTTNDAVQAAISLRVGFNALGVQKISDADRQALEDKLKGIDEERDRAVDAVNLGIISREQYLDKIKSLADQERDIHAQLEQDKFDISIAFASILVAAGKDFETQKALQVEQSVQRLTELNQLGLGFTAEAGAAQLDLLKDVGIATLGSMASALGTMIQESNVSLKALGNVALKGVFDLAKKQVAILSPSIIALFQSFIPPPFGFIAGTAAIGALQLGLDAAEGVIKLNKGGQVAPHLSASLGDVVPTMLTPTEIVMRPSVSQKYRDYLLGINEGDDPEDSFVKKYSHMFIDQHGRLLTLKVADRVEQTNRAVGDLAGEIRTGLNRLADGQDQVARRFENNSHVLIDGQFVQRGSDLIATIEQHNRTEATR